MTTRTHTHTHLCCNPSPLLGMGHFIVSSGMQESIVFRTCQVLNVLSKDRLRV